MMPEQDMDYISDPSGQAPGEHEKYHLSLPDGGPLYAETDTGRLIAEPWNALSSLTLVLPALYFFIRLRRQWRAYPFLAYCIPLLFLNGLGSALFHAFRVSRFFLWLDVFPAALLSLSVSVYFWLKVVNRWWQALLITLPVFFLRYSAYGWVSPHTATNLSYLFSGMLIFLPIVKYLYDQRFRHLTVILASVFALALALVFREMDAWQKVHLPMGTHFLWHLFSAAGGFFLAQYLYLIRKDELAEKQPATARAI